MHCQVISDHGHSQTHTSLDLFNLFLIFTKLVGTLRLLEGCSYLAKSGFKSYCRTEGHGVCVPIATPYRPRLTPQVSVSLKTDSKALASNPLIFALQTWCFERAEHVNLAYELQYTAGPRIIYWRNI